MWVYLLQGVTYGLAGAATPGPLQTFFIAQTVKHGWRRTLPAALAPLLSDAPIVLLVLFVLSRVPNSFQRILHLVSGLFILYLARGAYIAWRDYDPADLARPVSDRTLLKATAMNLINPNPYIYWSLVAGPAFLAGWHETPAYGIGFLVSFYATLVSGFALTILLFGTAQRLGPRVSRALLGVSAVALAGFGLYQLWLGFA